MLSRAELWKAAGRVHGAGRGVVVKGARAGEPVVCGMLIIWLNSWRAFIALLVLRSPSPGLSPVKTAPSQMPPRRRRVPLPDGSSDWSAVGTEVRGDPTSGVFTTTARNLSPCL